MRTSELKLDPGEGAIPASSQEDPRNTTHLVSAGKGKYLTFSPPARPSLSRAGRGTSTHQEFLVAEANPEEVPGLCVLDQEPGRRHWSSPRHPACRPPRSVSPSRMRAPSRQAASRWQAGGAGWPAPRQMAGSPAHGPVAPADGRAAGAEPGLSSLAPLSSQRPMSRVREASKQIHGTFFPAISSIK